MASLPSDSEDENLSDSDDEYMPSKPGSDSSTSSDSDDDSEDDQPLSNFLAKGTPKYQWNKVREGEVSVSLAPFTSQNLDDEPEIGRPIHYFQLFFSDELLDQIVEQSNLYACQVDPNRLLNLARSELKVFLGTVVYMSIFGLPRHRLYWSSATRVSQVADSMSRKRWEQIKKNLHFNNNENLPEDRNDVNRDKLFKLRPFLDNLQQKFANQVKPEKLCVDEQIVPFKGRSSLKQ